jgi:phenylacetate-CoA ligase
MLPIDRFPLITADGARGLRRVLEHPHAPRFTHSGMNRVTRAGLHRVRDFAAELHSAPPRWLPGEIPAWLTDFVTECYCAVPFYRRYGPPPRTLSAVEGFTDIPTTARADLQREPWAFVPDSQSLDGLLVYNTSGITGHPLDILTNADTLALYVPLLQAALATRGVTLAGGPERVSLALVCAQKQTYTFASSLAVLGQASFVKVNLKPADWRDPADRVRFLDDLAPEAFTGDPLAFAELLRLPLTARPKALVSTAMTLTPGLHRALEERFDCPVLNVISLNETGPLAVDVLGAHQLLQPHLFVEILNDEGTPCLPGERGEVTVSGGFNPFLPLLRYRTGDYARLDFRGAMPLLVDFEGRAPVVFRAHDGRPINNIDVSIALRPLPIAQFALHQFADGALRLRVHSAGVDEAQLREAVWALFGAEQPLTIEALSASGEKVIQYSSESL